jgi:hypothetical protein
MYIYGSGYFRPCSVLLIVPAVYYCILYYITQCYILEQAAACDNYNERRLYVQSCADTTHTRTVVQAIWMERSRYDDNVRVHNSSVVYTVYIF